VSGVYISAYILMCMQSRTHMHAYVHTYIQITI